MREDESSALLKLVVPALHPEVVAHRFLGGAVKELGAAAGAVWYPIAPAATGAAQPRRVLAVTPEGTRAAPVLPADHPVFEVLKRTPAALLSPEDGAAADLLPHPDGSRSAVILLAAGLRGVLAFAVPDRRAFPVHRVHGLKAPAERLGYALDQAAEHSALESSIKELKKKLAETQFLAGRMRALVENSLDLLFVLGYDGSIQMVSPSVTESVGLTPAELGGQSIFTFIHPEDVGRFMSGFRRRLLHRGLGEPEELRLKGAVGWRWVTARLNNRLDDPKVGGVILACHDITRLKQHAAELEAARREAEAANRARGAFLASMSHEIRTPMNSVIGLASLLEETRLDDQQREMLATIRASGETLVGIINQVLDLARIEAGEILLRPEPLDPLELVEEVLEVAAPLAADKQLELLAQVPLHIPRPLVADRQRLQQILLNLVTNAVKHTERGLVSVSGSLSGPPEAARLELEVRDTGHGIPETDLARIFQPFGQTAEGRVEGGTGLGLTITKELVEAMGGTIQVSSTVGSGSTFSVSLPVTLAEGAAPVPPGDVLAGRIVALDGCSEEAASVYTAWLRSDGASVIVTGGPMEGRLPDVVVVDGAGGPEAAMHQARTWREESGDPDLPVVILLPLGIQPPDALGTGAAVYKPVRRARLLTAVRSLLGMEQTRKEAPAPTPPPPQRRSLRVLLAEDNPVNRKVAMMMLERLDHHVDAVSSGPEVVDAARMGRYDVILMDLELPGFGGLEAARRIRELTLAHNPHIVAMTGHVLPADRERCFSAGMDGFLPKPVVLEELRAMLDRVPAPASPPSQERAGDAEPPAGPVDRARLEQIAAVTPGLLEQLVELFCADAPERIAAIARAARAGNVHEVAQSAHQLKGAAANMGARRLEELARQVENLARTGRRERLAELVPELESAFESARTVLENAVAEDDHGFVRG